MGIGASVLLIAVGAILTFALNASVGWLNLHVVGWIFMAAGVIGLLFTTMIWGPRRRATTVVRDETAPPVGPTEVRREDREIRY